MARAAVDRSAGTMEASGPRPSSMTSSYATSLRGRRPPRKGAGWALGGRSSPPPSHRSTSATTLHRPRKRIHPRQRRGEPRRSKPAEHVTNGWEWLIGSEPQMEMRRCTRWGQVHSWQLRGRGEGLSLHNSCFPLSDTLSMSLLKYVRTSTDGTRTVLKLRDGFHRCVAQQKEGTEMRQNLFVNLHIHSNV
ncbi:uncharacterized protein LOC110432166 [Sorghum bicolor]|uniref:uncharacterized protein LOC110432166 n=1 Tax=Sorghum bicolor TaxID=4558 RepID=UPI000B425D0E|nr:uncharacterized protein LOC110432166 [Sorghum bicolor]|eukprot:XP_021307787.1 uncharacterized protein LOC110432166 [Sorghum bicolor]